MRKLQRLKAKHKNQNHNGKSDAPNPQIPSVLVLKSQATDATRGDRRHYWLHGARVARSLLALIRWLACHVRRRSLSLTHAVLNETNTDQACWRSPIACIAWMTMLVTVESDVCTVNVRHFHDRNAIPVHCTPKRPPFSFFEQKDVRVAQCVTVLVPVHRTPSLLSEVHCFLNLSGTSLRFRIQDCRFWATRTTDFLPRHITTVARTGRRIEKLLLTTISDRHRNVKVNKIWLWLI